MRYFITLLSIVIMAYGCRTKGSKISLTEGKLITYTMPYSGNVGFSTNFTLTNGQKAIAFFNTESYKRMDLFTLDGKPIKTISLKELALLDHHIDDIVALNRDSFLALGQYHNNIYLFNSEGKVLQHTHINDTVPGNNPNWYTELSSNIVDGFKQDDSTLLLKCHYYERVEDTTLSKQASTLLYYRKSRSLPYFLSIRNVFAPSPQLQYALPGFYNRFLPDNGMSVEGAYYIVTPENVLLYSFYSDSLYVLDKHTYAVEKAIKIQSAYTTIGSAFETTESHDQDSLNTKLKAAGLITDALYDKYRGLYYVSVSHSQSRNASEPQMRLDRNWSLLVYDKHFKQLEEINMSSKFWCGGLLVVKEGIMIQLNNHQKPNALTQFQLFYVHKK